MYGAVTPHIDVANSHCTPWLQHNVTYTVTTLPNSTDEANSSSIILLSRRHNCCCILTYLQYFEHQTLHGSVTINKTLQPNYIQYCFRFHPWPENLSISVTNDRLSCMQFINGLSFTRHRPLDDPATVIVSVLLFFFHIPHHILGQQLKIPMQTKRCSPNWYDMLSFGMSKNHIAIAASVMTQTFDINTTSYWRLIYSYTSYWITLRFSNRCIVTFPLFSWVYLRSILPFNATIVWLIKIFIA